MTEGSRVAGGDLSQREGGHPDRRRAQPSAPGAETVPADVMAARLPCDGYPRWRCVLRPRCGESVSGKAGPG